ncbi:MAG: carboxypeptidase-like regulatory domain-containing protein [Saprospiraceae bacterium]
MKGISRKTKSTIAFLLMIGLILLSNSLIAQISGVIQGDDGETLIGANVVVKGTSTGTITDFDGKFELPDVSEGTPLVISYTGYTDKEVMAARDMVIVLSLGTDLEQVVVTGVFDARSSMESSVAISTLDAKKMDRLVSVSAADLFTNAPGVFVNSSAGETRNQVYTRGISAGSNYSLTSDANGYYYLSLQEGSGTLVRLFLSKPHKKHWVYKIL